MAFFEQLGKRLADAGQGVAQQTKNLADVTRLNSAISEKERKISQLYLAIGQSYYEATARMLPRNALNRSSKSTSCMRKLRNIGRRSSRSKGW